MIQWNSHCQFIPRCDCSHGCVNDGEDVARLLHTKILPPNAEPIRRGELFPQKGKIFSNICGDCDGVSVVRTINTSDSELSMKAQKQAQRRPNRESRGAIIASVAALRAISLEGFDEEYLVFVYDDPMDDEPLHAVIRANHSVPRPRQDLVRQDIQKAFLRQVA